ncbi:MAG: BMP family ABC transporter substrate-binding protein [Candidatus Limnocylindrales bacterium]
MRTRSMTLALLAVVAIAIPACTPAAPAGLKIGLVTDVGQLNDKNFNQFSWEGAQDGATKVGGTAASAVSAVSADIARNIQSFVDQRYDIIVTVGFAAGNDTARAAKANPNIKFIGVDQSFICIDAAGDPDTTFTCAGDPKTLLPNYQGIGWKEQQPGYLAGIVAASLSETGVIGAVGGTYSVPAIPNYIVGYANGAKSVNPAIQVVVQYVSPNPDAAAFADQAGGKAFAQQMLTANADVDVMFQVAGLTGNGVLQAACEAGILAIGVDVDQHESFPDAAACTVVSAEKKLKKNVSDAIVRVKDGTAVGGGLKLDLTTEDVGLSSFHEHSTLITPATQGLIDAAVAAMKANTLQACVTNDFGACVTGTNGALP